MWKLTPILQKIFGFLACIIIISLLWVIYSIFENASKNRRENEIVTLAKEIQKQTVIAKKEGKTYTVKQLAEQHLINGAFKDDVVLGYICINNYETLEVLCTSSNEDEGQSFKLDYNNLKD